MNLELIPVEKWDKTMVGVDGDADALGPGVFGVGLGAANANKRKQIMFSQELEKWEKEAVSNSVVG